MTIPNSLPQLAVGSHASGSGQACIMNAISYINGDTVITDMPSCADPALARIAINLNDSVCTHRSGKLLCPNCSHDMWMLGARIIGTASATSEWSAHDRHKLHVKLALWSARSVHNLVPARNKQNVQDLFEALDGWLDGTVGVGIVMAARDRVRAVDATTYYAAAAAYADGVDATTTAATTTTTYAAAAAYADGVDDATTTTTAAAATTTTATAAAAYADGVDDATTATAATTTTTYAAAAAAYAAYAADGVDDAFAAYAYTYAAYAYAYAADAAYAYAVAGGGKPLTKLQGAHLIIDEFERLTGRVPTKKIGEAEVQLVREGARL